MRSDIHALRQAMTGVQPLDTGSAVFTLGADGVDERLGGGFARCALHEIIPGGMLAVPAAIGFAAGLCQRAGLHASGDEAAPEKSGRPREIVWLRQTFNETESGKLYPPGLREIGLAPQALVLLCLKDATALLRAASEAAGCAGLGAIVIECAGDPAALDLTATRKLALAAEKSRVPILCLRALPKRGGSAAMTRWQVAPAPSRALQANAPGHPSFDVTLLRHRAGRDGLNWRLEWNHEELCFVEAPPLSGAVVSLPSDRQAAPAGKKIWRRTG